MNSPVLGRGNSLDQGWATRSGVEGVGNPAGMEHKGPTWEHWMREDRWEARVHESWGVFKARICDLGSAPGAEAMHGPGMCRKTWDLGGHMGKLGPWVKRLQHGVGGCRGHSETVPHLQARGASSQMSAPSTASPSTQLGVCKLLKISGL